MRRNSDTKVTHTMAIHAPQPPIKIWPYRCDIFFSGSSMVANPQGESEVYEFIRERIESVPHLEALLLLWNSRPQPWSLDNLAKRLYIDKNRAQLLLSDLAREGFLVLVPGTPDAYGYHSVSVDQDQLIAAVDATYRREVVRIATLIHSRPPSSVRDFARAFRFKKDKE
jgi:hypothetical protein